MTTKDPTSKAAGPTRQAKAVSMSAASALRAAIDGMERRHVVEPVAQLCREVKVHASTFYRAALIDGDGVERSMKEFYEEAKRRIEDRDNARRRSVPSSDIARLRVDLANAKETIKRLERVVDTREKAMKKLLGSQAMQSALDPDVTERLRTYDDLYERHIQVSEELERTRQEARAKEEDIESVRHMMQDYMRQNASLRKENAQLKETMGRGRIR
ncbi:hypothetical protein QOZ88_11435 [Blastococcus sp. BMG 814]|uniref:Uncharacterized protein n=1 Tax=Blastococcus carthaginiensis TaxID=3050034 RepID=A0ABT9IDL5_9ACTN|nr:hypothetical protein [Blastococcus carthaginiensis]MDP5183252.1 hypothetical protein [Blastococcus carthaginiensis]